MYKCTNDVFIAVIALFEIMKIGVIRYKKLYMALVK